MGQLEDETEAKQLSQSILDEPTNEYTMRHAANLLSRTFGHGTAHADAMSDDERGVIDFAYQQLLRGANTLHDSTKGVGDE